MLSSRADPVLQALTNRIMDLSGLTDKDYLEVTANILIGEDKTYQCAACLSSTLPEMRTNGKGCAGGRRWQLNEHLVLDRCPGNFAEPAFGFWVRAWQASKKGNLPFEGTFTEQPAKALDLFTLLDSLEVERVEKENKKQEKKSKRKG